MWTIKTPYRVIIQPAEGDAYGEWLCETYSQARKLCDGLQDKIMDSTTTHVAVWIEKTN